MKLEIFVRIILYCVVLMFAFYYFFYSIKYLSMGLKDKKNLKIDFINKNKKYDNIINNAINEVISRENIDEYNYIEKIIHNNALRANTRFLKSRNEAIYKNKLKNIDIGIMKNSIILILSITCYILVIFLLSTYLI